MWNEQLKSKFPLNTTETTYGFVASSSFSNISKTQIFQAFVPKINSPKQVYHPKITEIGPGLFFHVNLCPLPPPSTHNVQVLGEFFYSNFSTQHSPLLAKLAWTFVPLLSCKNCCYWKCFQIQSNRAPVPHRTSSVCSPMLVIFCGFLALSLGLSWAMRK